MSTSEATIGRLRSDLAMQIAGWVRRRELTQLAGAKRLGIPQPTLSKIMNGRVSELSLELLIRITVRAQLPIVLQTGKDPAEAGAYSSEVDLPEPGGTRSRVADEARQSLSAASQRMTPAGRLEAHARHSELLAEFRRAGQAAMRKSR